MGFLFISGIEGLLNAGNSATLDHRHLTVQHSQLLNDEGAVYERDVENEKENGNFFKLLSSQYKEVDFRLSIAFPEPDQQLPLLAGKFPKRQIFLEKRHLRI